MELTEEQIQTLRSKAEAEDAEAQYEMGWRHAIGMGLEADDVEALRWLRLAADQGHQLAQNNLGARYAKGDGVDQDLIEAYVWFCRAAAQGDRKAGKNRDSIGGDMTAEQLAEARSRLN
tara:strand:+ start:601 stop:957 length:357 start_codon:yes stop_codon:yes gene_type:complete